jgi:hypothetical protein
MEDGSEDYITHKHDTRARVRVEMVASEEPRAEKKFLTPRGLLLLGVPVPPPPAGA